VKVKIENFHKPKSENSKIKIHSAIAITQEELLPASVSVLIFQFLFTPSFVIISNAVIILEVIAIGRLNSKQFHSSKASGFFLIFFLDVFSIFFMFHLFNIFAFLAFSFFEVFGFSSSSSSLSEDVSYLIFSYSDEVSESELTSLLTSLGLVLFLRLRLRLEVEGSELCVFQIEFSCIRNSALLSTLVVLFC